jgi:hypothetical protein
MVEGAGALFGVLNKILEIFQQKAFVYVDVALGSEKTFCLTVVNKSTFDILLKKLTAEPDGFPDIKNGYLLSESDLFNNKLLKPGQKLKFFFKPKEKIGKRVFSISYSTVIKNKEIPRYEQTCEYDFDSATYSLRVVASLDTAWKIEGANEKTPSE